jgi:hypothetical protein
LQLAPAPLQFHPMKLPRLFKKPAREALPETVRADDLFIVSYPKSGNTWQRFLLANLLRPSEEITFLTINQIVPDVHQASHEELERQPSPRILKSHEAYTPRYPKALYVTRDPRSVAVSMYHFLIGTKRFRASQPMEEFVNGFLRGKYFRHFGSWGANVTSWVSQVDAGNRNILLLRYEDMKKNTVDELRRVASFLGLAADDHSLQSAVEKSSFERMQSLEEERNKLKPRENWDASRRFVRKGSVDEWKELFSPEQNEMICRTFAEPMQRMNYL